MAKKRDKQSNTPKHKSFKREQRLQSAKSWLPTYEGKNVFRGYRKRYGVDWPTALRELEMLGVEVDPAYTPGGAPYGVTWEEWEGMEDEDDEAI
jgi:hypothetical protein